AWLMFAFVDGFASQLLLDLYEQIPIAIRLIEPAIAGISALVAGILSDRIGRKRIVIFGFVSVGIAYAILGISNDVMGARAQIPLQVFTFYYIVNGFAIGLLWVLFTIVLWGDLSRTSTEKFYAVGNTPLFLTQIIAASSASTLFPSSESIPIFSLAAFFLFISVIPLLYAAETLSMKKIQERQLKIYTKEALRLKQKAEQKQ
ncbi:MAG: MFS transporter, partial [Candidatus Bathyarchaeota archaeon]|nr:MFS transporter [Candidatus Bathyarchaeota archaeon]